MSTGNQPMPSEFCNLKTDAEKIAAIKVLVESRKFNIIEDTAETLADIIHIVYEVAKDKPLFIKKTIS
jgi:hypothetical protein